MELLSIAAIVLSVIAIARTNDVLQKIAKLEKGLENGNINKTPLQSESYSSNENTEGGEMRTGSVGMNLNTEATNSIASPVIEDKKESAFITWLKEDWLLKLGGILVLMGVVFFLSLAYTDVGPQGKAIIGYLFGITLMMFGFKYAKKEIIGGSAIHLIGAIVVIMTTYVAQLPSEDFNVFDPYFATLLMFLTTVCIALTSYVYERAPLAHVGLCIAAFVPVLTGTVNQAFSSTLIYLGIVILGVLWLALVTKWRTLVLLAITIICIYSSMKIGGGIGTSTITFTESYLLVVLGILFYVTSLFSIMRSSGVTGKVDGFVALLNAGFALMWINHQVPEELAPIIIAVVGLIYAVGFFFVYKITDVYTSFLIYGGVALGLLTTSVVLEFSGPVEAITLLLMGAGVTLFTQYLSRDENITKVVTFFNLIPLFYVIKSVTMISWATYNGNSRGNIWEDLLVVFMAMAVYFGLYRYFIEKIKELGQISLFLFLALCITTLWQVLHLIIGGGFATFLSILVYTIVGLFVLLNATKERNDSKIKLARLWLGLVAARVIFWDAWQVGDIALGVLICVVIGVLLLSSTFIIRKVTTE